MQVPWQRLRAGTERLIWWVAVLLPAAVAATRVASVSCWRDDLAAVRGIGLVSIGGPSPLTTWLLQLVSFIPLGPLWYRMALSSVALLVVASALMMKLSHRLLEANVRGSFVNVPLAAMATLALGLGPTLQREATVGGGALIAVSLALGIYLIASKRIQRMPWSQRAVLGGLAGALLVENPIAGAVVAAALVAGAWSAPPWKLSKGWWLELAGAIVVVATLWAPFAIRMVAPGAWLHAGLDADLGGLSNLDTASRSISAFGAWRTELGLLLIIVAVVGLVVGLMRSRLRVSVMPLLALLLFDLFMPASVGGVLALDPLTTVRTIAIVTLAVASSLGMQSIIVTLIDMGLPLSRAAAVLLLLFNLTLVGVASENAFVVADRSDRDGTELFDDVGLRALPPRALLLVRSQPMVWRLLAAQVVDGIRPDVLVVPYPLLAYQGFAAHLLAHETGSALLLRDIAIQGTPGEHAMSRLADHRRLFVQLDPGWHQHLTSHLAPSGLWLSLTAQPAGKSERRMAAKVVGEQMSKWTDHLRHVQPPDTASEAVFRARYIEQALASAEAQDPQSTLDILTNLEKLFPNDVLVRSLRQRLDFAQGQQIDVSGLVR